MKVSRILLVIGALALPVVPAAAQGKALGTPAGARKPTTTAKPASTATTKSRGQLTLTEQIAQNRTLKTRLEGLLAGGTMTFAQATTGWRNEGQLVAAMNAAQHKGLPFSAIHTEVVTNGLNVIDAVATVKGAMLTTPETTIATARP